MSYIKILNIIQFCTFLDVDLLYSHNGRYLKYLQTYYPQYQHLNQSVKIIQKYTLFQLINRTVWFEKDQIESFEVVLVLAVSCLNRWKQYWLASVSSV